MKWVLPLAAGLLAALTVAAITLVALGHRANAGRTLTAVEIAAPPQQVWRWIEEPDKLKQWISWVVEIRTQPGSPAFGEGAKRVIVMRDPNEGGALMSIDGVCLKSRPPAYEELSLTTPGAFVGAETYRLTALDNGHTRLEVAGQFRYTMWMAQLMEPLITPAAQKKMDGDLAHLKTLVESSPTSAAR
jgi:uncharacterized protein YndB with AHSA1/START domain